MSYPADPARIPSLDIVRGVAVMGILAMNITAFAMPFQAYMNPLAYGMETSADRLSWLVSFILIEGKMRGLFSFLFGASALLVIERARNSGVPEAGAHYRRMAWLLVFGLIHFYLVWFGDILAGYAMLGMVLFLFRDLSTRSLTAWGLVLVTVQFVLFVFMAASISMLGELAAQPGADPEMLAQWHSIERQFGADSGALFEDLQRHRGSWIELTAFRIWERGADPFMGLLMMGWETLGYMLLGMAALKSGFLTGAWTVGRYARIALWGFAVSIPAYAGLAWLLTRDAFSIPAVAVANFAGTVPFRLVMIVAFAALIILLTRSGGALVDRIAAAGRAAFTNYLGTSIVMTSIFYGHGLGLYGEINRAGLWPFVLAAWAVMLIWSKWWLDRYRYGPIEWLWRSLARWRFEEMRRRPDPA